MYLAESGLSCGIWDPFPQPGMEPEPLALGAQSPRQWTKKVTTILVLHPRCHYHSLPTAWKINYKDQVSPGYKIQFQYCIVLRFFKLEPPSIISFQIVFQCFCGNLTSKTLPTTSSYCKSPSLYVPLAKCSGPEPRLLHCPFPNWHLLQMSNRNNSNLSAHKD